MEKDRRGGLVGAAVLILVGAVLLLNNLGWTTISLWDLLRLWPVLVIAAGLDLLVGRRSAWASVLVLVVVLALLAGGLWLISSTGPIAGPPGEQVTEPLQDASRASMEIGFGAGQLRIDSMAVPDRLLEGTVKLHRGERLARSAQVVDGTLNATLRSQGQWTTPFFMPAGQQGWDLSLNRDVPLRLVIDAGVGDVAVDLRRMTLTEFMAHMGVGRTTVTLPERGTFEARLDNGVGEIVVRVPAGLPVRVHSSTGLGTVSVPSSYQRDGDTYVSPGYVSAENRVELWVEIGIGLIQVEEYQGE
ncbi:MAG TPA: DUF5668 domain-containing protein [Anaerolineae bacterium]|nr:DUF5668 domain-containing protein [Anaerolineae bacterium]